MGIVNHIEVIFFVIPISEGLNIADMGNGVRWMFCTLNGDGGGFDVDLVRSMWRMSVTHLASVALCWARGLEYGLVDLYCQFRPRQVPWHDDRLRTR